MLSYNAKPAIVCWILRAFSVTIKANNNPPALGSDGTLLALLSKWRFPIPQLCIRAKHLTVGTWSPGHHYNNIPCLLQKSSRFNIHPVIFTSLCCEILQGAELQVEAVRGPSGPTTSSLLSTAAPFPALTASSRRWSIPVSPSGSESASLEPCLLWISSPLERIALVIVIVLSINPPEGAWPAAQSGWGGHREFLFPKHIFSSTTPSCPQPC